MSHSLSSTPTYRGPVSRTAGRTFAQGIDKTPVPYEVLLDICRRPRFAGTPGEQYVIDKYITSLPGVRPDAFENYWVLIPDGENNPSTMFSAHTDTVHKAKADNTPYKLSLKEGWLSVKGGGVLGADDGTGIWIMLNLIKAKVPGLYIFHREEEIGGNGSKFIAAQHKDLITDLGIKHCVSFDRKGTSDVITHQSCGRCCSDDFAEAFSAALNLGTPFTYRPDDTGSFTDSANYTDIIGECTNLSVGYYDQHTQAECQDLTFVSRLVNQLIALDWKSLPQTRQPGETDPDDFMLSDWTNYRGYDKYGDYPAPTGRVKARVTGKLNHFDLTEMVEAFPAEIADILISMGWTADEVADDLIATYDCNLDTWLGPVDDEEETA